jgi:hypothetical protein
MAISVFPEPVPASGLPKAVNVFTSSGTYTVPVGATWARIIAVGGGASGGATSTDATRAGSGGGSGSLIDRWVAVTAGSTHSVIIGAGGASRLGDNAAETGNAGGTTSVGTLVTNAIGGLGGYASDVSVGSTGGGGEKMGSPSFTTWNGSVVRATAGVGAGGFFGQVSAGFGSRGGGVGYGAGGGGGVRLVPSGAGAPGYVQITSY